MLRKCIRALTFFPRKGRWILLIMLTVYVSVIHWNYTSHPAKERKLTFTSFLPTKPIDGNTRQPTTAHIMPAHISVDSARNFLTLEVNMTALKHKVRDRKECAEVAADPGSFWRSQDVNGSLNTSDKDIARMGLAFSCGMLYPDFFTKTPVPTLYPIEIFYLSEPPIVSLDGVSNENRSVITLMNSSLVFKVGETVAFKIVMKDNMGRPKLKGGDQIRVWFEDYLTKSKMAAKIVDLSNGTYIASAPMQWAGTLSVMAALAYPREYLRAFVYTHQIIKAFRHVAGVFINNGASEATPCYHTQVVPAFDTTELCNLTDVNGAPWFCGRPVKSQLKCSHYAGSVVLLENVNYPVTDAEMELFNRSCRNSSDKLPCNKILPHATWTQEIPTGYIYKWAWHPRLCYIPDQNYTSCFQHKQVVIYGDSNARKHYYQIRDLSQCTEVKKALTKKWHRPLLCVHENNNFSVAWNPHTNPFMHGKDLATLDSLVPTSKAIDEIPSHGEYLIILHHYYHLTTSHISVIDELFRKIKDALVRLFKRNKHVQVVLQGPHISWFGWPEHYAAGDMLGTAIMDLQQAIFHDIKDKVILVAPWDMTIASKNMPYHVSITKDIFHTIAAFTCGR